MKKIIKTILAIVTRLTLARYKPHIIGITGSVGKTSAKEAISLVLSSKFKVRASRENYNNEIGLPLAVLGESSGNKNPLLWLKVIVNSLVKLIAAPYPEILVLEMGADRPGDIAYLNSLVGKLDVAVVSDIGISHLEFYPSQQALVKEKLAISKIVADGIIALNFDSPKILSNAHLINKPVSSYGFHPQASIRASDVLGAHFKVHYKGTVVPFFLPNTLGKPPIYAALAAAAAGIHFGMNLVDVSQALKNYQGPPGRLRIIPGVKRTTIIDDTYNAAPDSTIAALDALNSAAKGRKLLALGVMAELGKAEDEGIKQVAAKVIDSGPTMVFLVGSQAARLQAELVAGRFSGQIKTFGSADAAKIPIQGALAESDTILVKGSQASRMEKIVKEIMAEPLKASKLLVRQSSKWSY